MRKTEKWNIKKTHTRKKETQIFKGEFEYKKREEQKITPTHVHQTV